MKSKSKKQATLELVKLCCRALDDKKAGDLRVLDVSDQSSITDYLIIATATSDPHLRALRVELEKVIDATRTRIVGIETSLESGWTVVDVFDLMVHLFSADRRAQYGLENLWKDAVEVSVSKMLAVEKPKIVKKRAVAPRKTRVAKR
ncbi:MAG: ribosome silencing factor [Verrucomicrobia bacterium]|jgi:ribosome-associated protein|nr:ribosome silencing factor [Verrucomicrobiota bacterium]